MIFEHYSIVLPQKIKIEDFKLPILNNEQTLVNNFFYKDYT